MIRILEMDLSSETKVCTTFAYCWFSHKFSCENCFGLYIKQYS